MQTPIHAGLAPVRRRQQAAFLLRSLLFGLLVSSLAGLTFALVGWLRASEVSLGMLVGLVAIGPFAGAVVGLLWRGNWSRAAAAVDADYGLKDRAVTALACTSTPKRTALQDLQIDDAVSHLQKVQAERVVPLPITRMGFCAVGTLAVAMGLLTLLSCFQLGGIPADAPVAAVDEAISEQAVKIEEALRDFEEIAKQAQDEDLEKLVKNLKLKVDEFKQPGVDVKEALAKLSEMQAVIAARRGWQGSTTGHVRPRCGGTG